MPECNLEIARQPHESIPDACRNRYFRSAALETAIGQIGIMRKNFGVDYGRHLRQLRRIACTVSDGLLCKLMRPVYTVAEKN